MNLQPRIVGATLGALAALAVGGAGLAWAQEAPTTPSTEAPTTPSTEAPATDDGPAPRPDDCPDKGDRGGAGTGATTATDQISL